MSRVLPILFNTDMVRAILDGRKTVTRRIVKVPSYYPHFYKLPVNSDVALFYKDKQVFCIDGEKHIDAVYYKAPYKKGDILYVRETWQECCRRYPENVGHSGYCFKASLKDTRYGCIEECGAICKMRPSIHMPKSAARIWLEVTGVRVERLQDITEEQALKEGVSNEPLLEGGENFPALWRFVDTWNSTIKKSELEIYGWSANPYVWAIDFERCEKPREE